MATTNTEKKGKVSWKPASQILDVKPPAGKRGRWISTDGVRLARKLAEGWEIAGSDSVTFEGVNNINGAPEYRSLVYATMSEELAEARNAYYEDLTNKRSLTPAQRIKESDPDMADFITDDTTRE